MSIQGKKIKKLLRELEADAAGAAELREYAKFEVKLTGFGSAIVEAAYEHEVPQAVVARVLQISPSAVARRYGELAN
jgi:hypothetical protein